MLARIWSHSPHYWSCAQYYWSCSPHYWLDNNFHVDEIKAGACFIDTFFTIDCTSSLQPSVCLQICLPEKSKRKPPIMPYSFFFIAAKPLPYLRTNFPWYELCPQRYCEILSWRPKYQGTKIIVTMYYIVCYSITDEVKLDRVISFIMSVQSLVVWTVHYQDIQQTQRTQHKYIIGHIFRGI